MLSRFMTDNRLELDRLFDKYAGRTALIGPDLRLTYATLRQQILLAAIHMRNHCPQGGGQIGLYAENSALYPVLMQAAWQAGAVFVSFDVKAPLENLLNIVEPDLLITDQSVSAGRTAAIVHPDRLFEKPESNENMPEHLDSLDLDAEASVILTSGSSGTPKGVVHTIGNYVYSAWGTIDCLSMNRSDSWLVSLPLFHVGGLTIFFRTLLSGALSILPQNNRKLETPILQYQPGFLSLVPTQLIRFLEKPEMVAILKQCRGILLGGAAAPAWLIRKAIHLGIPVLPTYGSTESCAQATGVSPQAPEDERLTSGKVLRFRTVRLDEEQNIIIGGKTIFKHYLIDGGKPETCQQYEFKTNDLGRFDAAGNLVVLGRSDQIFQSGGENINPFEIEAVLAEQKGITAAAVVPVSHPEFGQVPWAFIQVTPPFEPEKVKQALRKWLPSYKIPKEILEMPVDDRINAMKPDRHKLTQIAENISKK